MSLPGALRERVEARLGPIRRSRPVGGGCINPAVRLELASGPIFLKYSQAPPAGLFAIEAEGLRQLRHRATELRIPQVVAVEDGGGEPWGWLALEWLEPGSRAADFDARLGRGLAALHRAEAPGWGWDHDGFIGSLPQANAPMDGWAGFWATRRLEPQLRRAVDAGLGPGPGSAWERLLRSLPNVLAPAEADGPSLLHGDLWSGNVLAAGGDPALVDPASYHGHREVDLAMSELFGGFSPAFYSAYEEVWPLRPGYPEVRRGVYQLYYLLVHVNLFGASYVAQTAHTLQRVLAAA